MSRVQQWRRDRGEAGAERGEGDGGRGDNKQTAAGHRVRHIQHRATGSWTHTEKYTEKTGRRKSALSGENGNCYKQIL